MSSSSDSDEEEKKRFLSVVEGYNASLSSSKKEKKIGKFDSKAASLKPVELKSKRDNLQVEERHVLDTTPEFRAFLSKKLDALIEQELDECRPNSQLSSNNCDNGGVRLLLTSKRKLTQDDLVQANTPKVINGKDRKKKLPKKSKTLQGDSDSSTDSDEEENSRLFEAAVSSDFVLKDTAISEHKKDKTSNSVC